jgi:thioesterase domain-containing protein
MVADLRAEAKRHVVAPPIGATHVAFLPKRPPAEHNHPVTPPGGHDAPHPHMNPQSLQSYLHQTIPLAAAMQVAVVMATDESVALCAPLAPNSNPHGTVFGGSATTLAILAAWSLLHGRLAASGFDGQLVIQRHTMEYRQPLAGTFTARAVFDAPNDWPRFTAMLARHGKARLTVTATLEHEGAAAGHFSGEFVALAAH